MTTIEKLREITERPAFANTETGLHLLGAAEELEAAHARIAELEMALRAAAEAFWYHGHSPEARRCERVLAAPAEEP